LQIKPHPGDRPCDSTYENYYVAGITVKVYVCYRTYMNANISLTKAYEPPHCPDMRQGRYHAESR